MAWMGRRSVCHNETARHYVRSRDFGGLLSPARRARWAAKNIRLGRTRDPARFAHRSEEHTSELQSLRHLVCRLLLEKKKVTYASRMPQPTTPNTLPPRHRLPAL